MTPGPPPLGLYLHWPYCARICPYCDFNVVRDRGRQAEQARLVEAMLADLRAHAALTSPRRLASIFLGGGTPSLMAPEAAARLIEAACALWTPESDLEVTLEANPTDAEAGRFAAFADAGVTRLSLGLQSLDDAELGFLGRDHDAAAGLRAVEHARAVFGRLSIDLIYALPGQSPAAWARALERAASLGAEHISPYQLTLEPGTAMALAARRGTFTPVAPDLAADFYDVTQSVLSGLGFDAYEVSNHARAPTARSRHNLIGWRGHDYAGVGPGAHGRLTLAAGRIATLAPRAIGAYVGRVSATGIGSAHEALSLREVALERLLMGLRTVEGVGLDELALLGVSERTAARLGELVEVTRGRLTVTARGRPVLDSVVAALADGD